PYWALDSSTEDENDDDNASSFGEQGKDSKPDDDDDEHSTTEKATVRKSMNDDGENTKEDAAMKSPMEVALTAITQLLRMRIRTVAESKTGKRNGVGVLLYGCDTLRAMRGGGRWHHDDDNEDDSDEEKMILPSTHELLELVPPGIDQVEKIRACLMSGGKKRRDLEMEFSIGCHRAMDEKGGLSMEQEDDGARCLKSALHEANKIFMHAKLSFLCVKSDTPSNKLPDSKSLWIFTNVDNPCHNNEGDAKQVAAIAKDVIENGIDIYLLPLPKKEKDGEFDRSIFYDKFISSENDVYDFTQSDGSLDVEAVLDSFDRAIRKVRKYTVLPMFLPGRRDRQDDPGIMLDLYSIVQIKTKPQAVTVHQELNRATQVNRRIVEKDTGTEVAPSRLHTYSEFCGGRVSIRKEDINKMKTLCNSNKDQSLILFGFKSMHTLSSTNLIGKPLLAFGNDSVVHGSRKAFFNLKQSMMRKGVYAIGELLLRKSSPAKMVAMIPQHDSHGGFQIIPLPFRDEARSIALDDVAFADQNLVDAASCMVSKSVITTDEQFSSILPENPYLGYFFNFLESVTLGGKLIKPDDEARMNEAMMLESARKEMEDFALSLPADEVARGDRKRKQPLTSKSLKKFNVNVPSVPFEETIPRKWIEMYRNDEIADCNANELKEFLRSIGERVGGKKSDLVDRIHRAILKQLTRKS
ncbi:hypothetical protein HJC23_014095, partial [Cyclotella cryptica]